MKTDSLPSDLRLAHQAIYSLEDAAGVQIACREGTVWLTLDGDPRDIVLEAGEVFTTPQHRHALVYALQPSRISLATAARPRVFQDSLVHRKFPWPLSLSRDSLG